MRRKTAVGLLCTVAAPTVLAGAASGLLRLQAGCAAPRVHRGGGRIGRPGDPHGLRTARVHHRLGRRLAQRGLLHRCLPHRGFLC